METSPQLLGTVQKTILCADLDISDHFTWKTLTKQRAYGGTCAAVKALEYCIISILTEFLSKIEIEIS